MKIMHTADWHLGKIVNGIHMTEDQAFVLQQLLTLIEQEKPDVLIIAGDLYDRSVPPKEAVELLNKTLTAIITEYQVPVIAVSGNHDSPDRLEFGSRLFRTQQLYLETKLASALQPVRLEDEAGPVYFHLIPYLEPAEARTFFEDKAISSHQTAMEAVIRHIEQHHNLNERHVFVGHAFMAGGMESESEERLSMIGGTPYIEARLFDRFCYTALGHLHQPQRVTRDHIRYSGSLLKYSFSEASHKKSVTMIDLDENGNCSLTPHYLIPKRDMRILTGYFEDLMAGGSSEDYLHIQLLDDGQLVDPMGKLRKRYPNVLRLERKAAASQLQLHDLKRIREKQKMSLVELFEAFYKDMKGQEMPEERKVHVERVVQTLLQQERGK